jgi:hypothetical protein
MLVYFADFNAGNQLVFQRHNNEILTPLKVLPNCVPENVYCIR